MGDQKLKDLIIDYLIKMEGPETATEIAKGIGAKHGKAIKETLTSFVTSGALVSFKTNHKTLYDVIPPSETNGHVTMPSTPNNDGTASTITSPNENMASPTSSINNDTIASPLSIPEDINLTAKEIDTILPLMTVFIEYVGQIKSEIKQMREEMKALVIATIPIDNKSPEPDQSPSSYENQQPKKHDCAVQTDTEQNFITPKRTFKPTQNNCWADSVAPNKEAPISNLQQMNRFMPLAFVNNDKPTRNDYDVDVIQEIPPPHPGTTTTLKTNKRPIVCYTEKHLTNFVPVRPGKSSYAGATKNGRKVLVLSDSMMQRIRKREFNENLKNATSKIKCFPGATPNYMHHYVVPDLIEEAPDTLVIHSGTNSIYDNSKADADIANDVLNIARTARSFGVRHIMVSSIVQRLAGINIDRRRRSINNILYSKCSNENVSYIDNDNIFQEDISATDRVHLVETGSIKLANNILNAVNSIY